MEDQDPANPHCCQDLSLYEEEEVALDEAALRLLRGALRRSAHSHRMAGERLGMGLSRIRQRLYGRLPFTRREVEILCQLIGVEVEEVPGMAPEEVH